MNAVLHTIDEADNVAVALKELARGDSLLPFQAGYSVVSAIPAGHKVAIQKIICGEAVRKYGQPIGVATRTIEPGEHVHSNNMKTALSGSFDYAYSGNSKNVVAPCASISSVSFQGYRRQNGRVGTRNEIWILSTVGCVNAIAADVAAEAHQRYAGQVDGVFAFPHQYGCSQLGGDLDATRQILAGLAQHPNAGGVLIMGLGCENNRLDDLVGLIDEQALERVRYLAIQDCEDERADALAAIADLVTVAAMDRRSECSSKDLVVGVKCGGSDAYSGLTANPLMGQVANDVSAHGGRVLMSEIPEMFGAETHLLARTVNREVFDGLIEQFRMFRDELVANGHPVSENPSPGNIAGGLTTLEEKSLGAVQKGGAVPVQDVLEYGRPARCDGLTIVSAPGNDGVSSTALAAAGATVLLFSTGRGTPLGFPVPTMKIASNSALAKKKPHWIDFDAGPYLTDAGGKVDVLDAMMQKIASVASGERTQNERLGSREIAIWKRGVTL